MLDYHRTLKEPFVRMKACAQISFRSLEKGGLERKMRLDFFALFYHLSESKEVENQAEIELTINLLAHTSNHFICPISVAKRSSKEPCYTFEVTRT